MGVRKSQAAPIATAIRRGSGFSPSFFAILAAIGAMMRTVAALLRKGVTAMAAIMTRATFPLGGSSRAMTDSPLAMISAAPVLLIESLIGMRHARRTRIGASIAEYASLIDRTRVTTSRMAAPKNAAVTGTSFVATAVTAMPRIMSG